jgi:SAM-dependent methyltransferase
MTAMPINDRRSPDFHVRKFILENRDRFAGKIVLDIPAGAGSVSGVLKEIGCTVEPLDLFPEYFKVKDLKCMRADLSQNIPAGDSHADYIICVEGIEHISDQIRAFREFNRVLKLGGRLAITTPNHSNLLSKLSYLLFESEYLNKLMPPNEIDTIWMSGNLNTDEMYYGHSFLLGVQRMRFFAKLSGLKIVKIHFVRLSKTSFFLFPFLYPFILLSSYMTYRNAIRKNSNIPVAIQKKTYKELLALNINPRILVDHCLFVEFEKEAELGQLNFSTHTLSRNFKSFR